MVKAGIVSFAYIYTFFSERKDNDVNVNIHQNNITQNGRQNAAKPVQLPHQQCAQWSSHNLLWRISSSCYSTLEQFRTDCADVHLDLRISIWLSTRWWDTGIFFSVKDDVILKSHSVRHVFVMMSLLIRDDVIISLSFTDDGIIVSLSVMVDVVMTSRSTGHGVINHITIS